MNNRTLYFPDEVTGVTVKPLDFGTAVIGIGDHTRFVVKGFKYIYESSTYPRTVVPTEVVEVSGTEWHITFYNMDKNKSANITVNSVLASGD
ncbi:hypothetical protein [Bacillus mycoides]|uniref:hypothetical protein n=1 Tax=Bacillus mycoides TaxID=1405 RepID=UPI003D651C57